MSSASTGPSCSIFERASCPACHPLPGPEARSRSFIALLGATRAGEKAIDRGIDFPAPRRAFPVGDADAAATVSQSRSLAPPATAAASSRAPRSRGSPPSLARREDVPRPRGLIRRRQAHLARGVEEGERERERERGEDGGRAAACSAYALFICWPHPEGHLPGIGF
jgi:hypothetical protein